MFYLTSYLLLYRHFEFQLDLSFLFHFSQSFIL